MPQAVSSVEQSLLRGREAFDLNVERDFLISAWFGIAAGDDEPGRRADFGGGDRAAQERRIRRFVVVPPEDHVAVFHARFTGWGVALHFGHVNTLTVAKSELLANRVGHIQRRNAEPGALDLALRAELFVLLPRQATRDGETYSLVAAAE